MLHHPRPFAALAFLVLLGGTVSVPVGAVESQKTAGVIYWGGCLPDSQQTLRTLDTYIPATHFSYEAMQEFATRGVLLDGPERNYSGRVPYTEREWAEIVAGQLAKMELLAGVGAPVFEGRRHNLGRRPLHQLRRVSGPFLTQIGIDAAWSESAAQVADDYLLSGRPQGVTIPLTANPGPYNGAAREAGRKAARLAWVRGERSLLTTQPLPEPTPPVTALQWRAVPGEIPAAEQGQFTVGYNRETWRLLYEYGDGQGTWLSVVSDPQGAWQRGKQRRIRLESDHQRVTDPSGTLTFVANFNYEGKRPLIRLTSSGEAIPQGGPFLTHLLGPVELRMGPPGTGVYLLRAPVDFEYGPSCPPGRPYRFRFNSRHDQEMQHRLYVIDLGSGAVLNAVAVP